MDDPPRNAHREYVVVGAAPYGVAVQIHVLLLDAPFGIMNGRRQLARIITASD